VLPVLTGLGLWLAFPGGGEIWPLLAIALVPLLFALRAGSLRMAAMSGLAAGLVHFLLLLYWIVIVLGKYGGLAWFISVPALLLLALYMSTYVVLFAVLARMVLDAFPAAAAIWLLPALWVGLDWLRGVLFTGFPWMDLGYALYQSPVLIQIADLVGHHGVTFVIVFCNTLVFLLFAGRRALSANLLLISFALFLLGAAGLYSIMRQAEVSKVVAAPATERITVGIVQGNIDQSVKWSPSEQKSTVDAYLSLTASLMNTKTSAPPSLVVWPETALPFYPPANDHMGPLGKLVAGRDMALLTGAPWYEVVDPRNRKVKYYNSALLLQPDGTFADKYFKSHLVPFGEYVPLKKLLPFLAPLVEAVGDFSAGTIERPLVWKRAKTGILICFESVFPELSRQWVQAGANILVNLTNDAWYGKSSAPYHSLAMSVLRAVEARRSLIRSANTGISAFVSPVGAVEVRSGLFEPWAAAREVALVEEMTIWVRFGYLFAPLCLIMGLGGAVAAWRRRSRIPQTRRV
jgi:apolipoprotein N-acyltransferase